MISWLISKTSESGSGTPASGAPAQMAAWPEECALRPLRETPIEEDKAAKGQYSFPRKTAALFRPDPDKGDFTGFYEAKPAFEAMIGWGVERGEEAFIS
jgi:hypothetical protein